MTILRDFEGSHLREEIALVETVDSVVHVHLHLLLEEDWPSVKTIIAPEHCETRLEITLHQRPCRERGRGGSRKAVKSDRRKSRRSV